jgi:hypothetical protein
MAMKTMTKMSDRFENVSEAAMTSVLFWMIPIPARDVSGRVRPDGYKVSNLIIDAAISMVSGILQAPLCATSRNVKFL